MNTYYRAYLMETPMTFIKGGGGNAATANGGAITSGQVMGVTGTKKPVAPITVIIGNLRIKLGALG